MAHDAYAPCPCGSGKKLKFCCGEILPDLERAQRLLDNQPDAAEQILRRLHEQHPEKDSVTSVLADLLQRSGRLDELRELLISHLRQHPDHPQSLLGLAELCLIEDGFEASRRIVHRAFQLCARSHPQALAVLAQRIARELMEAGCYIAVREHLAMSVRVAQGELRRQAMMMLGSFEGTPGIPYPFRSGYPLLTVDGAVATQEQDQRARKLCLLGCFEPAAILYSRLTEAEPQNGALWHNLGLCAAWDARPADAIPALRKAAELLDDRDLATEAEALAQLLDQEISGDKASSMELNLELRSVSEALSRLDDVPDLHRQPPDEDDSDETDTAVASYDVLSRAWEDREPQSTDELPTMIGMLTIFDRVDPDDDDEAPLLEIIAGEDGLAAASKRVREVLGDVIVTPPEDEAATVRSSVPIEQELVDCRVFRPPGTKPRVHRRLQREWVEKVIEKWLDRPHAALGDRTPRSAADDADLKVALKAAAMNLHARIVSNGDPCELGDLLKKLNLTLGDPVAIPANAQVAAFPSYRYFRIAPETLTDSQLKELANRTAMLSFVDIASRAFDTLLERPEAAELYGVRLACLMRAGLARTEGDYERAFELFQKIRDELAGETDAFRQLLEIDIRELTLRLEDPSDPKLVELLHHFRDRYLRKIPEIGAIVREQLADSDCSHLIPELGDEVAVSSASQLWTGSEGSAEPEPQSGSKLWLPGQD